MSGVVLDSINRSIGFMEIGGYENTSLKKMSHDD